MRVHQYQEIVLKLNNFRVLHSTNVAVIREVYDSEYSQHSFSMELEKALDSKCCVIVIEPSQLGDETARWISFGNCLHKTAVITGVASLVSGKQLLFISKPY